MNCQLNKELASKCYPEGEAQDTFQYESLRNIRHPSTWFMADAGFDPGYLGSCPFWLNVEDRVTEGALAKLREDWMGDSGCTYTEFFTEIGHLLHCAYPTITRQNRFVAALPANKFNSE